MWLGNLRLSGDCWTSIILGKCAFSARNGATTVAATADAAPLALRQHHKQLEGWCIWKVGSSPLYSYQQKQQQSQCP